MERWPLWFEGSSRKMLAFRQDLFDGKGLYIKLKLSNGRIGYDIYFFATWCIKYFFDLKLKIVTAISEAPAPCVFYQFVRTLSETNLQWMTKKTVSAISILLTQSVFMLGFVENFDEKSTFQLCK